MLRLQRTVLDAMGSIRPNGMPPNTHRRGSSLWNHLPFYIPDSYLFVYLRHIDEFILDQPGRTMYLHGFVVLPVPVTTEVRHSFYDLFLMNIPEAVGELVRDRSFFMG